MITHLVDNAKIVRDQQQCHTNLTLQRLNQVQDLRLHRDIECRRRLVGDHQARATGNRHGNHNPLPHATGQLMRITAHHHFWRCYLHLLE